MTRGAYRREERRHQRPRTLFRTPTGTTAIGTGPVVVVTFGLPAVLDPAPDPNNEFHSSLILVS